ncbi:MAG TPA: hypothetical protein V6C72_01395, partial [Chroococcales cyanobacterium]
LEEMQYWPSGATSTGAAAPSVATASSKSNNAVQPATAKKSFLGKIGKGLAAVGVFALDMIAGDMGTPYGYGYGSSGYGSSPYGYAGFSPYSSVYAGSNWASSTMGPSYPSSFYGSTHSIPSTYPWQLSGAGSFGGP